MAIDILIVDDENDIRKLIKGILEDEGYATRQANDSTKAYAEIEAKTPHIVILDIWLQGSEHDGLEILKNIKAKYPLLPVIMISGHGTIETAVSAIKIGAYDFIEKPFKSDRLLLMIERALEVANLKKENEALKEKNDTPFHFIAQSPAMASIASAMEKVANVNSRVFFTGDSGTGKELAARHLHKLSSRKDMPFAVLNCATMDGPELEQELFGVEDGRTIRKGLIENANGGTLFLNEVSLMPLEAQGKLVRFLQEQKFIRINGKENIPADIRVFSASSRNLKEAIARGDFREDLFYRLNVVPVQIPPLKMRREDIPLLAAHFAEIHAKQAGQAIRAFGESAIAALQNYDWPGNVRQLKNVVEWAMIMCAGEQRDIEKKDLPPEITGEAVSGQARAASIHDYLTYPLREAREAFERDYLERQLARFNGNISKTAAYVGMERSALHRKLKSLDLSNGEREEILVTSLKQAG
jgi:two-component system nitrogen regulation response regulator NtrX